MVVQGSNGPILGLVTFLIAAVATGVLLPVLRRHLVDTPNQRSSHSAQIPRGGGLAVAAAITTGALMTSGSFVEGIPFLTWVGLGILAITGLVDDVRSLGSRPRLLMQVLVALLVCLPSSSANPAGVAWVVVLMVFVVGFVNAFNFMDGIDGISAGTVLVAGVWMAVLHQSGKVDDTGQMGWVLIGASLGFLAWNASGRVFLGDVGSYFLGGLLAVLTITAVESGAPLLPMLAPMVLYVGDTTLTLVRRAMAGAPIGIAHRDHVYQRLSRAGLSHLTVAAMVCFFEALMCLVVWAMDGANLAVITAWLVVFAGYAAMPRTVQRLVGVRT